MKADARFSTGKECFESLPYPWVAGGSQHGIPSHDTLAWGYAYAIDVFSADKIARKLHEGVAFPSAMLCVSTVSLMS